MPVNARSAFITVNIRPNPMIIANLYSVLSKLMTVVYEVYRVKGFCESPVDVSTCQHMRECRSVREHRREYHKSCVKYTEATRHRLYQ